MGMEPAETVYITGPGEQAKSAARRVYTIQPVKQEREKPTARNDAKRRLKKSQPARQHQAQPWQTVWLAGDKLAIQALIRYIAHKVAAAHAITGSNSVKVP